MKDICYNQKFITPELDLKEATLLFTKDETMLIVGRKLMKLSKYSSSVAHKIEDFDNKENIKENANKKVLFEEKTIGSCYQKDIGKMLSLDDISSTQKLRIIEETLKRNPTLVYSYVENIIHLILKTGVKESPLLIDMIENASTIALERILALLLKYRAYKAAVRAYISMGKYVEAFDLSSKQKSIALMGAVVKKSYHDYRCFDFLFRQLIGYIEKNRYYKCDEESIIDLISMHPNMIDCIDLLPNKLLQNTKIVKLLLSIITSYNVQNRILLKAKEMKTNQYLDSIDSNYLSQGPKGKMVQTEICDHCRKAIISDKGNMRIKGVVQFFSCTHAFHKQCLDRMIDYEKKISCPLCL